MATVVTYWQTHEDEKDFLAFLQRLGNVLAFPNAWFETQAEVHPKPMIEYIERYDPTQLNFTLEKHALRVEVVSQQFDGKTLFGVSAMRSCLIAYKRPIFRNGNELGQSNICADWRYLEENEVRVLAKDEDFAKRCKKVFTWVRKATLEEHELNGFPYRATKRAKQAFVERRYVPAF